ncbi:MAG: LPS assembly protein LptD [Pseudomonadota bacterium]
MVVAKGRWIKTLRSFVLLLPLVWCEFVYAQDTLTLVADRIVVSPDGAVITAQGNVVATYQGNVLETSLIEYDRRTGEISFPDPTVFKTQDGASISAQEAKVADNLISGSFSDVELRLGEQFRVLADQLDRIDEDRSILTTGVATTCFVCEETRTPFWQIRASEVEHRQDEQRLYFENAVFEFLGIPVFYAPRLRTPDPSVSRATGFLVPAFKTSNTLGLGVELPYFIALSDQSDLTLTPFASTEGALLLGGEYRQLFENGALFAEGAVALADPLTQNELRSFGTVRGYFDVGPDFDLSFQANATSDRSFRREYGFGDEDRLENFIALSRSRDVSFFETRASTTQSLREGEDTSEIPLVAPEIYFTRNDNLGLGWKVRNEYQSVTLFRENERRSARIGIRSTVKRNFLTQGGLGIEFAGRLEGAAYTTDNSDTFADGTYDYVLPSASATIRYPLSKRHASGGTSFVEPIAQLIFSPNTDINVPNEDSVQLEFEENNLFSMNRFPGFDRVEVGTRANVGLRYLYTSPNVWKVSANLGQVFRLRDPEEFDDVSATGLDAQYSDTVFALTFELADQLSVTNRTLIGRDFNISKYEAQLNYVSNTWGVGIDYIFLEDDVVVQTDDEQDQIDFRAFYNANEFWTLRAEIRQDFVDQEPIEQFFGAEFKNECILLDFGFTFDYATASDQEADQEFGLTIELLGFGGSRGSGGNYTC